MNLKALVGAIKVSSISPLSYSSGTLLQQSQDVALQNLKIAIVASASASGASRLSSRLRFQWTVQLAIAAVGDFVINLLNFGPNTKSVADQSGQIEAARVALDEQGNSLMGLLFDQLTAMEQ